MIKVFMIKRIYRLIMMKVSIYSISNVTTISRTHLNLSKNRLKKIPVDLCTDWLLKAGDKLLREQIRITPTHTDGHTERRR